MAYILQMTDGSTTVDFLDECGTSPWVQLDNAGLEIGFPAKKQTWAGSSVWRQGRTLAQHAYENRSIKLSFEIGGTSWDDIFDQITEINRLLESARASQLTGLSAEVELKYQIDTVTKALWFDILDGDLMVPQDLMSIEKMTWIKCGTHKVLKGCTLSLEVKPFARGEEITLVSAASVDNADDSTRNNYVSWAGSLVDGDVPGPIRVSFNRDYVDGVIRYNNYWIGVRDVGTPANYLHVFEAEDADEKYGSPSQSGSSSALSGLYSMSWSGIPAGEHRLLSWNIANQSDPLSAYTGKHRVVLVGSGVGSSNLLSIQLHFSETMIREYPWRRPNNNYMVDLGVIELPPWDLRPGQQSGEFKIEVHIKSDTVMSTGVDAIYLIPADDYKFRYWAWRGYQQSQGEIVVDHGLYDQVYFDNSGNPVGVLNWKGLPLHINPGAAGRLYFTWTRVGGGYNANYTAVVYAYHTPYYLNISRGDD